jgi:integrase/recombinase XerD
MKVLTLNEINAVIANLRYKRRYVNNRQTLVIARLACCCGLRVSEICGLRLDDVRLGSERPHIRIRRELGKGGKARTVPLTWDAGTLADLTAWKAERESQGGTYFVCSQSVQSFGNRPDRRNVRRRFIGACHVLGKERQSELTIHAGRHSFCSLALAGGKTLVQVRDAAGHANISTTSKYLHLVADDASVGDLFAGSV